jgi:hypothetical protein
MRLRRRRPQPHTVGLIIPSRESAGRIEEILGIGRPGAPVGEHWADCQISFGSGEPATATVTFLLSIEETRALTEVMTPMHNNGAR